MDRCDLFIFHCALQTIGWEPKNELNQNYTFKKKKRTEAEDEDEVFTSLTTWTDKRGQSLQTGEGACAGCEQAGPERTAGRQSQQTFEDRTDHQNPAVLLSHLLEQHPIRAQRCRSQQRTSLSPEWERRASPQGWECSGHHCFSFFCSRLFFWW